MKGRRIPARRAKVARTAVPTLLLAALAIAVSGCAPIVHAITDRGTDVEPVRGPDGTQWMLIQCAHTKDCIKEAGSQCPTGYDLRHQGVEHEASYSTGAKGDPSILWDLDLELPREVTSVMVKCQQSEHFAAKPRGPGKRPAPRGAGGFRLGESKASVMYRCMGAGHAWDESDRRPTCSGTAEPVGMPVTARFKFCHGSLCVLELRLVPSHHGAGLSWKHSIAQLSNTLETRYGLANRERVHVPPACKTRIEECLVTGTAWVKARWQWQDGHRIALFTQAAADPPAISVKYIRPPNAPVAAAM